MPKSQFVEARRLRPLLGYCVSAVVVLLALDAAVTAAGAMWARQALVLAWMILFPTGGWLVWRRN